MKMHCPMCGEPWNGQRCEVCGWKEPKRKALAKSRERI